MVCQTTWGWCLVLVVQRCCLSKRKKRLNWVNHLAANPAQRSTETRQTRFKEPWLKTKHWTSLITEKNIRQHPKTTREHFVACLNVHMLLFSANKVHWQFSWFERNLDALCALCATILLQPCRSMAASVVVKVARVVVVPDLVDSTRASNGFPKEAGRAIGFCSTCASCARRDVALLT